MLCLLTPLRRGDAPLPFPETAFTLLQPAHGYCWHRPNFGKLPADFSRF